MRYQTDPAAGPCWQLGPQHSWFHGEIGGQNMLVTRYADGPVKEIALQIPGGDAAACPLTVRYADGSEARWTGDGKLFSAAYLNQFGLIISPDGEKLFVQTWGSGLHCLCLRTGQPLWRTKSRGSVRAVTLCRAGLVIHRPEKALQLLDTESGAVLKERAVRAYDHDDLDGRHIICQTTARTWEIIRADDLQTLLVIPDSAFPKDACVRQLWLDEGLLRWEAFVTRFDGPGEVASESLQGAIDVREAFSGTE